MGFWSGSLQRSRSTSDATGPWTAVEEVAFSRPIVCFHSPPTPHAPRQGVRNAATSHGLKNENLRIVSPLLAHRAAEERTYLWVTDGTSARGHSRHHWPRATLPSPGLGP
jgi:hypothetical protein